jgi:HK97 family phage major capsid protein/HK97 family phage prohead protease
MDDEQLEQLESAPPATLEVPVVRAITEHVELRADGGDDGDDADGPGTMVGHFSTFNTWYEIHSWFEGHFLERIAPGAFKRTIKNRNGETPVRVLLEHGFDWNVGDKPLGVPEVLEERDHGPYAEVPLFDTTYNRDLAPALAAGAYSQSFRFQVLRDEWVEEPEPSEHNPKGIPERTIKEVRLIEFGPTVFPANPSADAGLRSETDHYYERLRKRDADAYDKAVAHVRSARHVPAPPASEPEASAPPEDPQTGHSTDPPKRTTPKHSEDSPGQHSTDPSSKKPSIKTRSKTMDETMTVEERTARQSEIRARLAEIDTEYAGAALPEDVQTEWDELNTEHDEHQRSIESALARQERIRALGDKPGAGERSNPRETPAHIRRPENIYDLSAVRQEARSVDELGALYRDRAMRAVEQARFPGAEDRSKAQARVEKLLDSVDDEQGTLARRILVTGSPTYDRAFGKAVSSLTTMGLTAEEQRALSLGTDTAGGFAVPFQLDPTVILTSGGQVDPIRQIARVVEITGKEWQGITSAGVTVSRAAEGAEAGDNAPAIDQPAVKAERVQGFVPFSIEIDQDWAAMRSEITMMLGEAKATEESTSFVLGSGVAPAANGVVATLAASSHVAAAGEGVAVGDLYKVEEALPPRFRANARFLANRSIYNRVRQLDTAGGANLWVRLAAGLPPELIGYPAHEASAMDGTIDPAVTDTNLVLLFGDFSKFIIVDRIGMSVELVPHLFGANRRPTGQRGLYAIWRNNSKILADNAFRLLKVTTTL